MVVVEGGEISYAMYKGRGICLGVNGRIPFHLTACETAKFLITVGVGGTVNVCCVPVSATTDETGIQSSLSERGWHQSVEAYSIHCINVSL